MTQIIDFCNQYMSVFFAGGICSCTDRVLSTLFPLSLLSPSVVRGRPSLRRNCCLLSIRWNHRCVRGGAPCLLQLSVMTPLPAGGRSMELLCMDMVGDFWQRQRCWETNKDVVGVGDYFFPPRSSLDLAQNTSQPSEISEDMSAWKWAVFWKVDVLILAFYPEKYTRLQLLRDCLWGNLVPCAEMVAAQKAACSPVLVCALSRLKLSQDCLQATGKHWSILPVIIRQLLLWRGIPFARLRSKSGVWAWIVNTSIH